MTSNYLPMPVNITASAGYWRAGLPWYVPGATLTLARIIQPSWRVLEWGSGASTVFYNSRCCHVTSIDANPKWARRVRAHMTEHCPGVPQDIRCVPPEDILSVLPALDPPYDLIAIDTGPGIDRDAILRVSAERLTASTGTFVLDNYASPRHWPDTHRLRYRQLLTALQLDPDIWHCRYFTASRWIGRGTAILTTYR